MPSTIILFDNLSGTPSTGGTWARISSTGPAAPSPYNASIDFTGFPDADYVYRYSVTSGSVTHSSDITVSWKGSTPSRANDVCSNARRISGTQNSPFDVSHFDDNRGFCDAGISAPSLSGDPIPPQWNVGTYSGDLWYDFIPPVCTNIMEISVSVSANDTNNVGIRGPALELYRHNAGSSCASKTLVMSNASSTWETEVEGSLIIYPDDGEQVVKIRVSSPDGYQGQFEVNVTGTIPCEQDLECPDCPTIDESCWAWGEPDGDWTWGYEPENTWGEDC